MEKEILYPLDTANFKNIRQRGFVYVDKTEYIHKMTERGTYYFLARPRRFGKSLFLDTLGEYFKGNRELFKGLEIDKLHPEEWESYPVLRFNLSGQTYHDKNTLYTHLAERIRKYEEEFDLPTSTSTVSDRFYNLISALATASKKNVVILIDEYDAPLSSTIDKPDLQEIYREQLHGFYSVLKASEEHIQFCMLTGVTRYGKVSVFSGLNNLNDITFDNNFAGICGITTEELHRYYEEGVEILAHEFNMGKEGIYEKLKFYYDGYHFSPSLLDIYNPFCINYVFAKKEFKDYWCQSGVPTILSKSLMQNDYDVQELNNSLVEESTLANLSLHTTNLLPLFYQTGYLTLKGYDSEDGLFTVGYPNREVERGILNNILTVYNPGTKGVAATIVHMKRSLRVGRPEEFIKILSSFLADIPNQLHKYVDKYENYYHTIFYCLTTLIGLDVEAEYSTSEGFIDMLIKTSDYIYIMELKVNGTAEDALKQIEEKHYAAPFAVDQRKLVKIGIGFSTETHNINSYLIEAHRLP